VEIASHRNAVDEFIATLKGEREATMEGDRLGVEGAGLCRDERSDLLALEYQKPPLFR